MTLSEGAGVQQRKKKSSKQQTVEHKHPSWSVIVECRKESVDIAHALQSVCMISLTVSRRVKKGQVLKYSC